MNWTEEKLREHIGDVRGKPEERRKGRGMKRQPKKERSEREEESGGKRRKENK